MLPRVRIGEMRERVTIEVAANTVNPYGEEIEAWGPIATNPIVPAEVLAISGREAVNAQQAKAIVGYRVRIRYRADVTPAHRFNYRGKTLTIAWGGDPDGRRRELAFYCSEVVALAVAEES